MMHSIVLLSSAFSDYPTSSKWAGQRSRYSDWLRTGRSGDRIPVRARFSAPVQTGPRAHPAYCTMGTGSFPWVKSGRGVTLAPHPFKCPWSRKSRDILLLLLWAVRPVQSLSAYIRVHFTSFLPYTSSEVFFLLSLLTSSASSSS